MLCLNDYRQFERGQRCSAVRDRRGQGQAPRMRHGRRAGPSSVCCALTGDAVLRPLASTPALQIAQGRAGRLHSGVRRPGRGIPRRTRGRVATTLQDRSSRNVRTNEGFQVGADLLSCATALPLWLSGGAFSVPTRVPTSAISTEAAALTTLTTRKEYRWLRYRD